MTKVTPTRRQREGCCGLRSCKPIFRPMILVSGPAISKLLLCSRMTANEQLRAGPEGDGPWSASCGYIADRALNIKHISTGRPVRGRVSPNGIFGGKATEGHRNFAVRSAGSPIFLMAHGYRHPRDARQIRES
jgi:hypothetical protein